MQLNNIACKWVVSLFAVILAAKFLSTGAKGDEPSTVAPRDSRDSRLAWWREARFGMFIHWGPISIKGTDISWSRDGERRGCPLKVPGTVPAEEYDNLYKQFNPTKFDAAQWISIAQSAGMKYMVLTAKHCDGFCLWNSKASDYNISHTPFGRDICGELAQAAHHAGMHLGWYYSPMDWRDPDCRTDRNEKYVASMQEQLRELLGNYGPIDLLWFDCDGGPTPWDQRHTYALVRNLQPRIVIDNRLDVGNLDEYHHDKITSDGDYYTPEQRVGNFDDKCPWETSMTLGTQWSWKPNDRIKSIKECVQILVRCAGGDGNLLLDVGPMPTGEIEPRQVDVLKGIGNWLQQCGESIYGTRGGPILPSDNIYSTRRGNIIYVHVLKWNGNTITLPALPYKIIESNLLTGGQVKIDQSPAQVILEVSPADQQEVDTIIKLKLEGSTNDIPHLNLPISEKAASTN